VKVDVPRCIPDNQATFKLNKADISGSVAMTNPNNKDIVDSYGNTLLSGVNLVQGCARFYVSASATPAADQLAYQNSATITDSTGRCCACQDGLWGVQTVSLTTTTKADGSANTNCKIAYCGRRYTYTANGATATASDYCQASEHTNKQTPTNCAYCMHGYVLKQSSSPITQCVAVPTLATPESKTMYGCLSLDATNGRCQACAWPLVLAKTSSSTSCTWPKWNYLE
jgi:hypothetical protein